MIKVSDYIFKFLSGKNLKQVFMLPGGGAMHLVDSLGKSGIRYLCCLHEQAASIAAEAYGQHTNHIGVVLVTSGPGSTNAITGVTAGWIDSTPMIVLSGQAKRSDLVCDSGVRQIGSQEVQIVEIIKPITKYAVQILEPNDIKYHLERAYHEATSGRPGPVWLDVPLDVQGTVIDETCLQGFEPETESLRIISDEISKTIKLIKAAKKPLILSGNGIKLAGATEEFFKLKDMLRVPVQTTWKIIDMLDENDPFYVGHPGIMGDRGANMILQESDLLISIGSRLDSSITAYNEPNFGKQAKKIIIDIDKNEIKRMQINFEVAMCCDAKYFIKALISSLEKQSNLLPDYHEWVCYCKSLRAKYPVVTSEHKNVTDYVSAYYFIDVLCDALGSNDIIVPESSGAAGEITYQAFRIKKGQKMKNAAGLGSMGFGLPYAIGSCIANNKKRTILINGDGAFQLNIQELETLARLQLPIKIFIWNNDGFASIRSTQRNIFGGHYVASSESSGLSMPSISRVANAYGIPATMISNNAELEARINDILDSDGPILCELKISPDETVSPRVKSIALPDGRMISGPLENMWPYLD